MICFSSPLLFLKAKEWPSGSGYLSTGQLSRMKCHYRGMWSTPMCASWVSHQHGGTCSWSSILTHSSDDSLLQSLQSCTKYVLVEEEGNRILMSNLWTPTAALLDSCWYCYPHSVVKHDYTAYQKEQKRISDEHAFSCLLLEPDRARQTLHLCPFFFKWAQNRWHY